MSVLNILLIVAGVGYILARRMIGQLLEIKSLLVLPAVLTIIGVTQAAKIHSGGVATIVFAALGIAVSIGLGLLRGRTVHLGDRGGELWMRYRVSSVGLWVLNLAVKGAVLPVEHAISPVATTAAEKTMLLSIGLGILAETAVVLLRALQAESTVAWEKGEDGRPHLSSAAFEKARSYVQEAGSLGAAGKRLRVPDRDW